MRKVIVNTTPLIALANVGQLDILNKLYGNIMIPEAVFGEIKSEPARTAVSGYSHCPGNRLSLLRGGAGYGDRAG